jgi:CRISPR-associated protein Csd1
MRDRLGRKRERQMIIQRLYELSVRERLLEDPAFSNQPIKWAIQIGRDGEYLGLVELEGEARTSGKGKSQANLGKPLPVPLPTGSRNSAGFAHYFADAIWRVLPVRFDLPDPSAPDAVAELEKRARSRTTFWRQVNEATDATNDPALVAMRSFGGRLEDPEILETINTGLAAKGATATDRCTFAWHDDYGATILEREPLKEFYRSHFDKSSSEKKGAGPVGVCQITGDVGPLPTTHPLKIAGIPGGLATGVSLVSFDKDAFQSYGLDGAANAGIGYRAADGYCRALTALIRQEIADGVPTSVRTTDTIFLIWTRDRADVVGDIVRSLEQATDEAVTRIKSDLKTDREGRAEIRRAGDLMESAREGKTGVSGPKDPNRLYCLALAGNAARAIVRSYLEVPLPEATASVAQWFSDLSIVRVESKGAVAVTSAFPVWILAAATAREPKDVSPEIYSQLLSAALSGPAAPLPDSMLIACLKRNRSEASQTVFKAARMALIKLILLRRNVKVSESLDESNTNPAYVCGRLLALFEDIQREALGPVNANVGDKFYGNFSATPSMVFARLHENARKHIRKIRGDNSGGDFGYTERLSNLMSLMSAPPPGVLSPLDQGMFALGYYHQLNEKFRAINDRKAASAAKANEAAMPASS